MKLDLFCIAYRGEFDETVELPDDGIICETSWKSLGRNDITGYLYVTTNTEEHYKLIDSNSSVKMNVTFTPTQIVVFLDSCKIKNESDISFSTLDELNSYMDFNYWLTVSNFKRVTINELKQLYDDNPVDWLKFIYHYIKPIRFTGNGCDVEVFMVGKNDPLYPLKKLDIITKCVKDFTYLDDDGHWSDDNVKWHKFNELNDDVEQRIKEILSF